MKLYKKKKYAEKVGVSRWTMDIWVKDGRLPPGVTTWTDASGNLWIVEKESEPCQESNQSTTDG